MVRGTLYGVVLGNSQLSLTAPVIREVDSVVTLIVTHSAVVTETELVVVMSNSYGRHQSNLITIGRFWSKVLT